MSSYPSGMFPWSSGDRLKTIAPSVDDTIGLEVVIIESVKGIELNRMPEKIFNSILLMCCLTLQQIMCKYRPVSNKDTNWSLQSHSKLQGHSSFFAVRIEQCLLNWDLLLFDSGYNICFALSCVPSCRIANLGSLHSSVVLPVPAILRPGFESLAHNLCFFNLQFWNLNCL